MHNKNQLNIAALKTITIYLITGGLWILFSDSILNSLVNNQAILTEMQTLKGWLFIFITAVLLYFLIKRYTGRIKISIIEKQAVEKHLDFFTRYAHDIILLLNDSGNVLEANERAVEAYEYTKDDLLKINFANLSAGKEFFSKAQLEKLKSEGGIIYESKHIRKSGSKFPVEISAKFIELEEKLFYQCIIRDISEREKNEEQIRKLSRVVEQSPGSIIITDTGGKIEYVNPSFTRLTGYEPEEVLGKNPSILKSGKNSEDLYQTLWNAITGGREWRGEILNKKKDGTLYWEYTLISPLRDRNNTITHFIAIKEDITRQKEMTEELINAKEKAEESDRLKSEFLAQMSHEIRTPLNVILSFNSLLKEELEEKVREDLTVSFSAIDSAGKRLLRTLNHILNMAAVQTGNFEISLSTVELSKIINHIVKEFEFPAKSKNLTLIFNRLTEETEINTDEYIVSEILQNLVDNAIKYTNTGSVTIQLAKNDSSGLYIKVSDTCIGISEEYLPKLFQAFTQEDSGYSRRFEGNGLGLALVRNYVDFIDAQIEVSSIKGEGSVFTLTFPNK